MAANNKKSIIDEIKNELEELEEQLKQSGAELKDNFKQKKQIIATQIKKYAKEFGESGEGKINELKESYRELIDLLEADYDLSYTDYENESNKISTAIDKFELKAKEIFQNLTSEVRQAKEKLEEEFNKNLSKFKTELDIQKAHFKGTKDRTVSEFDEWKTLRLKEIEAFKKELEKKKEETEGKFENFSDEISNSFDHLKKAFKNLW